MSWHDIHSCVTAAIAQTIPVPLHSSGPFPIGGGATLFFLN
jgi:hypothetical protein